MECIASPFLLYPQPDMGVANKKKDAGILAIIKVFFNFNMTIILICQITAAFILTGPHPERLSWCFCEFFIVHFCHFMMVSFAANSSRVRVQHLKAAFQDSTHAVAAGPLCSRTVHTSARSTSHLLREHMGTILIIKLSSQIRL